MADILPVELWWSILEYLSGQDLCQVALVSSYFRQLTKEPALWSWVKINMDKIEENGLDQLLNNHRLRKVKEIDISYLDLTDENISNVIKVIGRFKKNTYAIF